MNIGRTIFRYLILVVIILALLVETGIAYSYYYLIHTQYSISSSKTAAPFRIVFISDLHSREFGKNNGRLLEKIAAEKPDVIALVGDIFDENADEETVEKTCDFIGEAAKIAPVYFCMGNHEYDLMAKRDRSLKERIAEAGAVVLDASYVDIEINGTPVRLGGYEGYYRTPHMTSSNADRQAADMLFFEEFENTERFKLLLNHIPTNWLDWDYRDKCPVDLVLSGHYHGGVVRIPLLNRGLFAPYVGRFPPYTKGIFVGEKATCILSTGMAGAKGYPRLFNPPEIVVVDVCPA